MIPSLLPLLVVLYRYEHQREDWFSQPPWWSLCSRSHDFLLNSSFCSTVTPSFWHPRLVHPSHDRLSLLHKKYSYICNVTNFVCDACHKAKQKKLPSPLVFLIVYMCLGFYNFFEWFQIFFNHCG